MKYSLSITVQDPTGRISAALAAEHRKHDRGTVTIGKRKGALTITVTAADAVALRAGTHSMLQLLEVEEQMERITHGKR